MKYRFIKNHRNEFPIRKMAAVLNVSKSRYYQWSKNPGVKEKRDFDLVERIGKIFDQSKKQYGSPRIHSELLDQGITCGHNRVAKIMRNKGIKARIKRKYKVTTDSNHDYPVAPNIVNRQFNVDSPNKIWVSDITYIWTNEGWLYLCIVLDLFSRKVVGWAMSRNIDTQLVADSFTMAVLARNPEKGLIFHSDRGIQYAAHDFRRLLKDNHAVQSMSRKGNCWDNACAESFFSTLKNEEVFHKNYRTRKEARSSIFEYIAVFYNRFRKHTSLDYVSPEKYEKEWIRKFA